MAGRAYWRNRQAKLMYGRMDDTEVSARSVARIYAKASAEIETEMRSIFETYQTKWHLTKSDAQTLLSRLQGKQDLQSLRLAIASMPDSDSFRGIREQMLRELEAPAYQARLKRLQELQEQLDRTMTDVYQQDRKRQTEHYIQTGTDAYYRGIYDVQREAGFQFSFSHVDQKAFDRLLKSKWSGENYSDRIWENTRNVAAAVKDELLMEMLTGKSLDDCAEAIQHRFQVGAFQSRRIMRTESNFVSGQMQQQAYKECGSDYYEYVATLDSRTDEECGALDGKRFRLEDAQPGVNMHPMHPFCRCTTIIALDDEAKSDLKRRARDPKTGAESLIPAATTYEQWARDNDLIKNYDDVTELWNRGLRNNKSDISIDDHYSSPDGKRYEVDGKNVVQKHSDEEIKLARQVSKAKGRPVKMVPEVVGKYKGVKTPDFILIDGDAVERWEEKAIRCTGKDPLRNEMNRKKAEHYVFDVSKRETEISVVFQHAERVFKAYNTSYVQTVAIYENGTFVKVLSRK